MLSFPVILINSLSVLMICIIILISWQKRTHTGALELINASVFMLIWAVSSFVEMAVSGADMKILWRNITQIGVFYTPPACLLFAIAYTGLLSQYKRALTVALFSVQTISILLILTDHWHHLARISIEIVKNNLYETVVVHSTVLAKILISFNFIYMAASLILLISFAVYTPRKMRNQVLVILAGMSVSVFYSFIKVASAEHFGMLVPISGVFAVTNLTMLLGIMKYDLLMAAPIARNEILNIIDDGIIISSTNGKIVDVNVATFSIFNGTEPEAVKNKETVIHSIEQIIENSYPQWHNAQLNCKNGKFSFSWDREFETYYYQCDLYAIKNKRERAIGSISVIKDITDQKKKNELLKLKAEQDGLTGIYNRQAFVERVEQVLEDYDQDVGLLFFDIDDFKSINDYYGHISGDYVLKELCNCIQPQIGKDAIFSRLGGEEFAIFIKVTSIDGILQFAEDLRMSIEQHEFQLERQVIQVTISIGVSVGRCQSFHDLYHIADINLYQAKKDGKNCVRY